MKKSTQRVLQSIVSSDKTITFIESIRWCGISITRKRAFDKQIDFNLRTNKMIKCSTNNQQEWNKENTKKKEKKSLEKSNFYKSEGKRSLPWLFGHWYLSSHLQCISVLMRQLNNPYFVSKPFIQNGHFLSCWRQHRSAFERPPNSAYFLAEYPFPHHLVPGTRNRFVKSRRRLQFDGLCLVLCENGFFFSFLSSFFRHFQFETIS